MIMVQKSKGRQQKAACWVYFYNLLKAMYLNYNFHEFDWLTKTFAIYNLNMETLSGG